MATTQLPEGAGGDAAYDLLADLGACATVVSFLVVAKMLPPDLHAIADRWRAQSEATRNLLSQMSPTSHAEWPKVLEARERMRRLSGGQFNSTGEQHSGPASTDELPRMRLANAELSTALAAERSDLSPLASRDVAWLRTNLPIYDEHVAAFEREINS